MRHLIVLSLFSMFGQSNANRPVASPHVAGPNELEGWTLSVEVQEGLGPLPTSLVIARRGRVVRQIDGSPFVWKWKFESHGELVAFESGPLHFDMTCVLENIRTGKEIAVYDCYKELPQNAPAWVKELEAPNRASSNHASTTSDSIK